MKVWLIIVVGLVIAWVLACGMVAPVDSAPGQPTPTAAHPPTITPIVTPILDEYIWLPLVVFSKITLTPEPTVIPTYPPGYPTPAQPP